MVAGTVKTSSILVAMGGRTQVFRTLQEMPFALRRKVVRLAMGPDAATLRIADKKGAEEWLSSRGRMGWLLRIKGRGPGRLWLALAGSGLLTLALWAMGLVQL